MVLIRDIHATRYMIFCLSKKQVLIIVF